MTAPTSIPGGCACGAIRFEYSGKPVATLNCHCRDCQRASGTAFASLIGVDTDGFRMLQGEPSFFDRISDAGAPVRRGFCRECGSPLLIVEPDRPKVVYIQAASLDDPGSHRPEMNIFTRSAQPWDVLDDVLPGFSGMPPLPDNFGQ